MKPIKKPMAAVKKFHMIFPLLLCIAAASCCVYFTILCVDYPSEVVSNGDTGNLTVYWCGRPQFPVEMQYRPTEDGCPSGTNCTTPTMAFEERQNPLVFPGAIWCTGFDEAAELGYEVVLIDANGVETAPYPAPFTCIPPPSDDTTTTTSVNPCPPEEPILCVDEEYDSSQYWCCEEALPVCGKVEIVDGEPQGGCLPENGAQTTTTTTSSASEPPEETTLYLSTDSESDLLFYVHHSDDTIMFYNGFTTEAGMKLTHVASNEGSAIIFGDDFLALQWMFDGFTAAVYIVDDQTPFDPISAYHEVTDGEEFGSYTLDILPDDLAAILAQMETKTGEEFSDAAAFLTQYSITSFSDLVTRAQQSGSDQPRFIAAATAFGAAKAYLSMEAAESAAAKTGHITAFSPLTPIIKYPVQFVVSLLASKFNAEFGPQPPSDPDDPGVDVQLCRGQSSISYVCHYMFFKPSYPGSAGPCIDLCFTSLRCFTDICMPQTLSSQSAEDFREHFYQGQ